MSEAEKPSQFENKKLLIVVAIIGAGLGITFMGKSGKSDVEQVDVSAKPIEVGSDQINQITIHDKDAALTQFAKQFETMEQRFVLQERDSEKRQEELRKEMKDSNNNLKAQVAALSDDLIALRAQGVNAAYENANAKGSTALQTPPAPPNEMPKMDGLNFDGLDFNMSAPQPLAQQKKYPYGPNYFILKPEKTGPTFSNKSGGDSLNASEDELFSSMSQPAPQSENYNDKSAGQGQTTQQPQSQPQKQYNSAAEAYQDQQNNAQSQNPQANTGPRLERITIPAFSFVEVTTLHGVACPVGANSPGVKSQIPARPVVLPVRGIFRGPNGSSVDVGNIHLSGLCSGRRTSSSKTGRATVRVEQMSYWDESGDAQMASSTGYIVDTRDNEQDVYGRLDKASGRTLALESAAAAAAAFATTLSQAEYTTQNNLNSNGSTSTQQLTGSASQAAVSQGIGAMFSKIASRFEQEANAAIDTVVVEPGIRLRFVTDQPIHIYKPAEAFDLDAGKSDVLL